MDIIFPDVGLIHCLTQIVGVSLRYHLFQNDYTPTLEDTLGNFNEAAWSGYAPRTVVVADFSLQQIVAHVGGIQAAAVPFINTSPATVTVYGYFVTDSTDTILIASARFDLAPVTILVGGQYLVTPVIGTYSGLSS